MNENLKSQPAPPESTNHTGWEDLAESPVAPTTWEDLAHLEAPAHLNLTPTRSESTPTYSESPLAHPAPATPEAASNSTTDASPSETLESLETPLTPEEKKSRLNFETLKDLSTEEYLKLWRRLNPFYLTHVTRQGIRDHNAMIYHSAGMGEFHDGFTAVLADDKKLRSPAEVRFDLDREITEASVQKSLDKILPQVEVDIDGRRAQGFSDRAILDEIVNTLPINTTMAAADSWADPRAVHFGQLTALDDYYGAETDNEALFVFPTDVIASQCRFGGHTRDNLTTAETRSERKWNDMFVWPQEQDITIDAGLTFLPKTTPVDPATGSKYATKIIESNGHEARVPEVDEQAMAKFSEWLKTLKSDDEAVVAFTNFSKQNPQLLKQHALAAGVSERILDDVFDRPGSFPYNLHRFLEGGDLSDDMWLIPPDELAAMTPEQRREKSIQQYLDGRSSTWKLAENAIPAEEYWENYFQQHGEQRPAHVIYYDGDPSRAVRETLSQAGILEEVPFYQREDGIEITGHGDSHQRDGGWLGFEDHHVVDPSNDEAIQSEHQKFNELARKLIAKRYNLQVDSNKN